MKPETKMKANNAVREPLGDVGRNVFDQKSINHFWGEDGSYFQGWYPVLLSSELEAGKVIGIHFLGTRIITFRDTDGTAVVKSAYCPHFGADLAQGTLTDGILQCPYHHWRFGADGNCKHIPTSDNIPKAAKIYSYPTAEKWGMIWAFNGEEPLYDVPNFPGVDEDDMVCEYVALPDQACEAWVPPSNAFDVAHLGPVHGFYHIQLPKEVKVDPYSMHFTTDDGQEGKMWGATVYTHRLPFGNEDVYLLAGGMPIRPGWHRQFAAVGVRKLGADASMNQRMDQVRNLLFQRYNQEYKFFPEDDMVTRYARFRGVGEGVYVPTDIFVGRYLQYISNLPRAKAFDL